MTATSSPATLSFVESREPGVERVGAAPREPVGQDLRLFPERRDEAVQLTPVLGALADRVDPVRALAREIVADEDAAFHRQPGRLGELDVRTDACGDDDHVAGECRAVRKQNAG